MEIKGEQTNITIIQVSISRISSCLSILSWSSLFFTVVSLSFQTETTSLVSLFFFLFDYTFLIHYSISLSFYSFSFSFFQYHSILFFRFHYYQLSLHQSFRLINKFLCGRFRIRNNFQNILFTSSYGIIFIYSFIYI